MLKKINFQVKPIFVNALANQHYRRFLGRAKETLDFLLSRILIVFFFALLIVYSSREIVDLDLWLHLKTGEFILKNHAVPLADIFSFTLGQKPWINHEWLFQVTAYLAYSFRGADALITGQNILVCAIFLILFSAGVRQKNHVFVFAVLYLTLQAMAYRFTIRPDIFSIFFICLYFALTRSFVEYGSRTIWLLPFLQILWVNTHGFFFFGPFLILLFLAGELVKRNCRLPYAWNQVRRLEPAQTKTLGVVFGLSLLACLVNPHGLKGAAYPLFIIRDIFGDGKIIFQYIQELVRPVSFKNILDPNSFLYYKVLILLSLFAFRFNQRHIDMTDLILFLLFLPFSLSAVRNVAYFSVVAAGLVFSNFGLALDNQKETPLRFVPPKLKTAGLYLSFAFLFYYPAKDCQKYLNDAVFSFDTYELKSTLWGISEQRYPKKAVSFLLAHHFPRRLFNDFNSGSYLIGRAFPKRQVFIDGRTELYGTDFFKNYIEIGEGKKEKIEKTISRYQLKGFFLSTSGRGSLHTGLIKYLFRHPSWKVVYFDESALIFLKDTPENARLIKKHGLDLKAWSPPKADLLKIGIVLRNPFPYLDRARLLNMLGCYKAAAREAEAALVIMPNNAEASGYMADYYLFQAKDYPKAYAYIRNAIIYSGGDLQARAKLALIYHYLDSDDKAARVIDAVIKKRPGFSEGYYYKALILKYKDKPKSKELLAQAIKRSAKEPKYHDLLGDMLKEEGDMAGAGKEWKSALEYDGANEEIKNKIEGRGKKKRQYP